MSLSPNLARAKRPKSLPELYGRMGDLALRLRGFHDARKAGRPLPAGDEAALRNEFVGLERRIRAALGKPEPAPRKSPPGHLAQVLGFAPVAASIPGLQTATAKAAAEAVARPRKAAQAPPRSPHDPATDQAMILTPRENARRAKSQTQKGGAAKSPALPKRTYFAGRWFSQDPFQGQAFTQEEFQAVVDAPFPRPVKTRLGGTIPYLEALRRMSRATGVTNFPITRRDDPDEHEAMQAYTAYSEAGVGPTIGFNKGQTDRQVKRGAQRKNLYYRKNFKNGHRITPSERTRDAVNEISDDLKKKTKPFVKAALTSPLLDLPGLEGTKKAFDAYLDPIAGFGADLIVDALTSPLHTGAEFRTVFDPEETTENKLGAAANLVIGALTDQAGKRLGPVFKKAYRALRGSPLWAKAPGAKKRLFRKIEAAIRGEIPRDEATIRRMFAEAFGEASGEIQGHPTVVRGRRAPTSPTPFREENAPPFSSGKRTSPGPNGESFSDPQRKPPSVLARLHEQFERTKPATPTKPSPGALTPAEVEGYRSDYRRLTRHGRPDPRTPEGQKVRRLEALLQDVEVAGAKPPLVGPDGRPLSRPAPPSFDPLDPSAQRGRLRASVQAGKVSQGGIHLPEGVVATPDKPFPRQSASAVAAPPSGEPALDGLIDTFRQAKAFRNGREEAAARRLWQLRAAQWARETGRRAEEFYIGLKSRLDGGVPAHTLRQIAKLEDLEGYFVKEKVDLGFTISDQAKTGIATLPSGAQFPMFGGPGYRIRGIDPLAGADDNAWASSTEAIANAHHKLAREEKAVLQIGLNNSPTNVLASHGLIAIRGEINHAIKTGSVSEEALLAHIVATIKRFNKSKKWGGRPIKEPKTIDEFLQLIEHDQSIIDTFPRRKRFAEMFWDKPDRNGEPRNPFGTDYEKVARAMSDETVLELGKGPSSLMHIMSVDKDGVSKFDPSHPIYSWPVQGKNFGLVRKNDLELLVPPELFRLAEEQLSKRAGRRSSPSTGEIRNLVKSWLIYGNAPDERVKNRVLTVETARIIDVLRQESKGSETKAWYQAASRTIGAMTGKSDFSSFVHESFHDWRRSLAEPHVQTLERHFGKRDTVDFEEASARAFERYLRDGFAPHPDLRELFATIREAMVDVYRRLKGTPLEKSVHSEVRSVFDEMLGVDPNVSVPSGSPVALPKSTTARSRTAGPSASRFEPLPAPGERLARKRQRVQASVRRGAFR